MMKVHDIITYLQSLPEDMYENEDVIVAVDFSKNIMESKILQQEEGKLYRFEEPWFAIEMVKKGIHNDKPCVILSASAHDVTTILGPEELISELTDFNSNLNVFIEQGYYIYPSKEYPPDSDSIFADIQTITVKESNLSDDIYILFVAKRNVLTNIDIVN